MYTYRADAGATLKLVNGRLVVSVHNSSSTECTKRLRNHVDWKLAPWELPVDAVCECDSRIQMSTGFASGINTKHDSKAGQMLVCYIVYAIRNGFAHPQPQEID